MEDRTLPFCTFYWLFTYHLGTITKVNRQGITCIYFQTEWLFRTYHDIYYKNTTCGSLFQSFKFPHIYIYHPVHRNYQKTLYLINISISMVKSFGITYTVLDKCSILNYHNEFKTLVVLSLHSTLRFLFIAYLAHLRFYLHFHYIKIIIFFILCTEGRCQCF